MPQEILGQNHFSFSKPNTAMATKEDFHTVKLQRKQKKDSHTKNGKQKRFIFKGGKKPKKKNDKGARSGRDRELPIGELLHRARREQDKVRQRAATSRLLQRVLPDQELELAKANSDIQNPGPKRATVKVAHKTPTVEDRRRGPMPKGADGGIAHYYRGGGHRIAVLRNNGYTDEQIATMSHPQFKKALDEISKVDDEVGLTADFYGEEYDAYRDSVPAGPPVRAPGHKTPPPAAADDGCCTTAPTCTAAPQPSTPQPASASCAAPAVTSPVLSTPSACTAADTAASPAPLPSATSVADAPCCTHPPPTSSCAVADLSADCTDHPATSAEPAEPSPPLDPPAPSAGKCCENDSPPSGGDDSKHSRDPNPTHIPPDNPNCPGECPETVEDHYGRPLLAGLIVKDKICKKLALMDYGRPSTVIHQLTVVPCGIERRPIPDRPIPQVRENKEVARISYSRVKASVPSWFKFFLLFFRELFTFHFSSAFSVLNFSLAGSYKKIAQMIIVVSILPFLRWKRLVLYLATPSTFYTEVMLLLKSYHYTNIALFWLRYFKVGCADLVKVLLETFPSPFIFPMSTMFTMAIVFLSLATVLLLIWLFLGVFFEEVDVYYIPHMVTCVIRDYSVRRDSKLCALSIRQKLLCLPSFPLEDVMAAQALDGTERVITLLLDDSNLADPPGRSAWEVFFQRPGGPGPSSPPSDTGPPRSPSRNLSAYWGQERVCPGRRGREQGLRTTSLYLAALSQASAQFQLTETTRRRITTAVVRGSSGVPQQCRKGHAP